jgi:putative peptidoglycan lipid II flippase
MLFARNLVTVSTATLLTRVLGFVRDIGIAAVLGVGVFSDAFFAALQIPNLFRRLLAEGALNAAFVPLWLRVRKEAGEESACVFNEQVLGTLVATLAVIALVCITFAPGVVRLLTPGFVADAERFSAVAAARLNAEGHVAAGAFGLVAFNIAMLVAVGIIVALGLEASATVGVMLSAAIVFAGLWQVIVMARAVLRLREAPRAFRLRWSSDVRRFYALMLPGAVAVGIPQVKFIVGTMVASSSQHAVSWLYYANRLYELPAGMVSVAVAAVMVPVIAASVRSGEPEAIAGAQSRTIELAAGVALPAAVALALLAHPIAGTLFQRGAFDAEDTVAVAAALAMIVSGLPGQTLEKVFGAMCFAREDTRTPMLVGLAGLAVAALASVALFPIYGHIGVAAAIALSGWFGAVLLGIVLALRGWIAVDTAARWRLPRILLAAAIMGSVVAGLEALMVGPLGVTDTFLGRVAALVVLGVALYVALLAALKVARPREIAAAIRARL